MSTGEQYSPHNFKCISVFSLLLVCSEHFTDVHLKTAKMIQPLMMHLIFSKASTRTSCIDIMTRKGSDGQVGNQSTRATGYILCTEKTGSELFYKFRPQGFLKMADDRTCSMCDICFKVLCQSMNNFCVVIAQSRHKEVQQVTNNNHKLLMSKISEELWRASGWEASMLC